MRIRPANTADIIVLQKLAHSIWREYYPAIISIAQIDHMLEKMYNPAQIEFEMRDGYDWEIVEDGQAAIGFLSTRIEDGNALKVSKIYLETAYHGKGFGRKMLEHIDAKAGSAGVRTIYLYVNRSNERALKSYLRNGFEIVQKLDQDFGSGFVLNDYKLEKTLAY